MTFEAGPWHCFGGELLERLVAIAQQQCNSAAPVQQQQQPPVSISRNSLSGSSPPDNNKKTTTFIPDFSAVVRDDCTYLEITAQTYLLAYKSTLISKGSRSRDQIPHRFTVSNLRSLSVEVDGEEDEERPLWNNRHTTTSFQTLII